MTWVRLDDRFNEHPKVIQVGPLAGWLFMCGLTYSARNLTDGRLPYSLIPMLANFQGIATTNGMVGDDVHPYDLAGDLVIAGLWEEAENGDFLIHDYLEYNPSREQVLSERRANAERQNRWRSAKESNAVSNAVTNKPVDALVRVPRTRSRSRSPENELQEIEPVNSSKAEHVAPAREEPAANAAAASAAPPEPQQAIPKIQQKGQEFEALRAAFVERGLRSPPLTASAEMLAARRLLKLAREPDALAACWQDIRAGDYGDDYAQQHLSFVYLERQNRFENWRAWKEGENGEPKGSSKRRSENGGLRATPANHASGKPNPFAKYG